MGASIKIDDLAKQIIRLSGMTPEKDIKFVIQVLKKEKSCMKNFMRIMRKRLMREKRDIFW